MPTFFQFTQGSESRVRPTDSSPLLGRYRAVPPRPGIGPRRPSSPLGLLSGHYESGRDSIHVGYGALLVAEVEAGLGGGDGEAVGGTSRWERLWQGYLIDLFVDPRPSAVKRVVDRWWSRYGLLVFLPAALVCLPSFFAGRLAEAGLRVERFSFSPGGIEADVCSIQAVAWCAVPFPQYSFPDESSDGDDDGASGVLMRLARPVATFDSKIPGHGEARVQVNFWFFLFVYYGFYNLSALIWITKVFNLYRLNWWPQSFGFPVTVSLLAILSLALPIPVYFIPSTRFLTVHNTAWVSWTFIVMAMPVAIAFLILMTNERHIGLRHSLSETQRIFTTSWWTGEPDSFPNRERRRRDLPDDLWEQDVLRVLPPSGPSRVALRRRWLPASFVRFLWFCVALFIGLMAYVLGEAYAEIYLRTLPHNSLETVVYVYGWVVTVHLLDALTGWTYVRALYARLRSPSQFVILQILSSTGLVIISPIMMTRLFHKILTILGLSGLTYGTYQKLQTRNLFIRFLAENTSMATFLGSILVLHFGANKEVYPYFAFDKAEDKTLQYDFNLTFYASMVTWGCELVASLVVRGLIALFFGIDVGLEGKLDLAVWPELLPTSVAVILHVLQNMLFSIIRLQFRT
ncbi:hypothetical protein Trco_002570 [Trichoderma cornu-damae]|uniref:Uncharacterized protein n=1 Tax=Trichoderma cornu-damae TaxID=654480 RepID=A0A9P8QQ32_9HYPO|nr:hypothetical protein Trco_002570 [Trichoderma cornu-damae]